MSIAFDLISDLHVETWPDTFNWGGQATSPLCVVAGDIAADPEIARAVLQHLSSQYAGVFYIDGNDEHRLHLDNLSNSYKNLVKSINRLKRVTYLQDNVIVIDGVAIIGTNGWWGFDLDENISIDESMSAMRQRYESHIPEVIVNTQQIADLSRSDAAYLINTVERLQTHKDIKKIVIVTHTVPGADLIKHDINLHGTARFNTAGNSLLRLVLDRDTEHKIDTWCFGHYHQSVDRLINGVRYVNNCRGRGDTPFRQYAYYPKRIEINV